MSKIYTFIFCSYRLYQRINIDRADSLTNFRIYRLYLYHKRFCLKMTNKKENIQWLDTLRTLATLGVVLIHVSSPIVNTTFHQNLNYWWIGNFLMSLTRYAVPMFLLLSGATMLHQEYKLSEFYRKRLMRVVVPFLFWIIVYFFFRYFTLPTKTPPVGFNNILSWARKLFITEGVSKHFWYIYMIIFIYLLLPILSKVAKKVSNKNMPYLLISWIIIASWCTRYAANMYLFTDLGRIFKYVLFTGYLFLGSYIYTQVKVSNSIRIISFIIFICTVAISAFSVYFTSIAANRTNQNIYNYMSLNTIIQSIALFILIKNWEIKNKIVEFINKEISNYSYGIYLVHILILGIMYNHKIFWSMAHPIISIPIVFTLALVTSYFTIYLLRKIPYGKYISG